jgi:hypothetical protein
MEKMGNNQHNLSRPNLEIYMAQLTEIEKKALLIAQEHLGSSFNILKSNGYLNWLKSQNKK